MAIAETYERFTLSEEHDLTVAELAAKLSQQVRELESLRVAASNLGEWLTANVF